jgi:chromosome segregation ATPase
VEYEIAALKKDNKDLKSKLKDCVNRLEEAERKLKSSTTDSGEQIKDVKERNVELKKENERFKKNLVDLAKVNKKSNIDHQYQIKEIKSKCNSYKDKVRIANEKINNLGSKIAHLELEYRNMQ